MSYYDNALKLRATMDSAGAMLTDEQAITVPMLYKAWEAGVDYITGDRRLYGDKLYKCLQAHTSQESWTPDAVPALWAVIDETHTGSIDDPIPYEGNMTLEQGKYYSQDGVVYVCIRDTINPVYHALADLVGLYVEVA